MLNFFVPPGIGDMSAMWEKLYPIALKREIGVQCAGDGPPRILPFLDILPNLTNLGAGHFTTGIVLNYCLPGGTDLNSLEDGEYFLSINAWMDTGRTVDEWSPGPTVYHYPFNISEDKHKAAKAAISAARIAGKNGPIIGIYASAYSNVRNWGFWQTAEWYTLIRKIALKTGATFVFIGAEYDTDLGTLLYEMCLSEGIPAVNTIGCFHIGSTVELIRQLDYFFVFPSGLGFLADVVNTPHVMWFPPNLPAMMEKFPDPENLKTHQTQHRQFETPEQSYENFLQYGERFLIERATCSQKR